MVFLDEQDMCILFCSSHLCTMSFSNILLHAYPELSTKTKQKKVLYALSHQILT